MSAVKFLLAFSFAAGLLSCKPVNKTAAAPLPEKESEKELLLRTGAEILTLLKEEQFAALSAYVDPEAGLLFAPYAYIDHSKNVTLKHEALAAYSRDDRQLFWGMHDGSGDSINLNLREYDKVFMYTDEYLEAELVQIDRSAAKGNTINNISTVFSDCTWIEYYFPGHEAKYEGMDWSALRLVFRKKEGKFYLVAIVHDQWTV